MAELTWTEEHRGQTPVEVLQAVNGACAKAAAKGNFVLQECLMGTRLQDGKPFASLRFAGTERQSAA